MTKKSPPTYTLRILKGKPSTLPMDRLGEYLCKFADLLGKENSPVFKQIKNKSIGIVAAIKESNVQDVQVRILTAKAKPESKAGRALAGLNSLLSEDRVETAELLDTNSNVAYIFKKELEVSESTPRVYMDGSVDGVVLGIMGRDETMHLHLEDHLGRDLRLLVRSETLARELLVHFRSKPIRLNVEGYWVRRDDGWVPETSKCRIQSFVQLDDAPASEIFKQFASVSKNGWLDISDPISFLKELRGDGEDLH